MKRLWFSLIVALTILTSRPALLAEAQTAIPPTPTAGITGEVTGTVINRNTGKPVTAVLDVMLHVTDLDFNDTGMLHAESQPDGTFAFADVPFTANSQFSVMAVYEDATYVSEAVPADMDTMKASVEVPVYESTADLSTLQVDQIHVIFDLAEDGLETREIYIVSNTGDRTVQDSYKLGSDQTATLEFPLPKDADFIFFKPEDQDRFVKLDGGFADTFPMLPEVQNQFMVSYLVPYEGKRDYSYTAPMNIAQVNFLLPGESELSITGAGLMEPEPMTLPNGKSYQVYSFMGVQQGQTVSLTIAGKGQVSAASAGTTSKTTPIAIGTAFVGFAAIGAGLWFWRRQNGNAKELEPEDGLSPDFDQTIDEIARLDQAHENGEVGEAEYREKRQELREQARKLLEPPSKDG